MIILFGIVFPGGSLSSHSDVVRRAQEARSALQTPPQSLPTYQTDNPSEVRLNDPAALDKGTLQAYQSKGGQFMKESLEKRPYFRLNPETDPLFHFSQQVHHNHEAVVKGQSLRITEPLLGKTCYCSEGRPLTEINCTESLQTGVVTQRKKTYLRTRHHGWLRDCLDFDRSYTHTPDEYDRIVDEDYDGCNYWIYRITQYYKFEVRGHEVNFKTGLKEDNGWQEVDEVTYNAVTPEKDQQNDVWVSNCPALAQRVARGSCRVKEKKCISKTPTKIIEGTEPLTVSRPCWQYEVIYTCEGSSKQECDSLRQRGCIQVNSLCEKKIGSECVEWRQKMSCPSGQRVVKEMKGSDKVFDLGDQNPSLDSAPNNDLNKVIASLSLFNEMGKEVSGSLAGFEVFKGSVNKCTKAFGGFKECCKRQGGWGVSLGLSECGVEDQALAQKRSRHLCVEVGEFCADQIAGICLRKKRSFCCFETKISRIFHEQGRRQIGLGFGNPEEPNCRGLTVEELQRIDFSRINLSEIYQDIMRSVKLPAPQQITQTLTDRLNAMTQGIKNRATQGGM